MTIALAVLLFLNNNNKGSVDTTNIGDSKAKIDTVINNIKDTVEVKGKDKLRIDTLYIIDSTKLASLYKDTTALKIKFDSIYPRKPLDTTNTKVGYSQISQSILTKYELDRDSAKLSITESQLSTCTTGVNTLEGKIDTLVNLSKETAKESYNLGYKDGSKYNIWKISTLGLIILTVGIVLGAQ